MIFIYTRIYYVQYSYVRIHICVWCILHCVQKEMALGGLYRIAGTLAELGGGRGGGLDLFL
jgi:hypothetical protein